MSFHNPRGGWMENLRYPVEVMRDEAQNEEVVARAERGSRDSEPLSQLQRALLRHPLE